MTKTFVPLVLGGISVWPAHFVTRFVTHRARIVMSRNARLESLGTQKCASNADVAQW